MRNARVVFLLSLLGWSSASAQAGLGADARRRIDSLVDRYVADSQATGGTLVVTRGGRVLFARGFGERDRERHLPATLETVYPIGSITKTFTAAAVMRLVEQGRVSLDAPVTTYLPEFAAWRAVTIRHLLSHTSGIPLASPAWRTLPDRGVSQADYLRLLKDSIVGPPGVEYRYNNTGYRVLGLVIEAVTGRPYGKELATAIFEPLGMRTARMCRDDEADPDVAREYERLVGAVSPTTSGSVTVLFAAGALCMTAPDLARWANGLAAGRVVAPATLGRMARSDTVGGAPTNYGWGIVPGRLGSHRTMWHNGAVGGAQSQMLLLPDDSLVVVALTNVKYHPLERLVANVASAVLGLPLAGEPPVVPVAIDRAALERYAGTYELSASFGRMPLRVALEGDTLFASADGHGVGHVALVHVGDDTFAIPSRPGVRLRFAGREGPPASVELVQGGPTIRGRRVPDVR